MKSELKHTLQVMGEEARDYRIDLEKRAYELVVQLDNVEQYGHRSNMCISGI